MPSYHLPGAFALLLLSCCSTFVQLAHSTSLSREMFDGKVCAPAPERIPKAHVASWKEREKKKCSVRFRRWNRTFCCSRKESERETSINISASNLDPVQRSREEDDVVVRLIPCTPALLTQKFRTKNLCRDHQVTRIESCQPFRTVREI